MNSKILRRASSALANPMMPFPIRPSLESRFAPVGGRSRFSASPRTRLIDPNLLDRLQSPLTRFHD